MASYLLPISDRDALAWILHDERTALPAYRRGDASRLKTGDTLFLYTTRGCFHNPTRDRGRVIGVAIVADQPRDLDEPVRFSDREFTIGIDFRIEFLVPRDEGVELAPLVPSLSETFPNEQAWSARLRRALVPLASRDAARIARELKRLKPSRVEDAGPTYEPGRNGRRVRPDVLAT
jgi:hypothetical protein